MKRTNKMETANRTESTHTGDMSPQELIEMARKLMALAEAKLSQVPDVPVARGPRGPYAVKEQPTRKTCPHCGREGSIGHMFGYKEVKLMQGGKVHVETRPQSWCRACRAGDDSHPGRKAS